MSCDKSSGKDDMKQAKTKFEEVLRPRLNGASRLAERLGISRGYLWLLRTDAGAASRADPKLLRRLRKFGVAVANAECTMQNAECTMAGAAE